jgi:membrane-bound lytic murein transglycosylase D
MMKEILKREGMPEDLVYVAMIESGFQLHARSWANAVGPWQFVSDTGRRYSLRIDQWIDERKDPVKATTAAALYLKELYGMFNGDWYLAAAGYNAGENKILRAINMYNTNDFWEISRGSYLKRETKEYVPKLLAAAIIAKDPARYGFLDIAYLPAIEFETVKIPSRTDLELVAKLSGTTYETIRELNPDLRHWCTPPNYPGYDLKLPKGTKQQFELEYSKIPEDKRFTEKVLYTHYHAGKRDSLKAIARRFGTSPETLTELNSLSKKSRITGKTLVVPVRQTMDFGHEGRTAHASSKKGNYSKFYTVKKGDTLDALAKRFNVSIKLLSTWNKLKNKVALKPGRRIIIAKFIEKNGAMIPSVEKS